MPNDPLMDRIKELEVENEELRAALEAATAEKETKAPRKRAKNEDS